MAITTSKFATVTDAVITALRASPTFADPVRVFDGPAATDAGWFDAVFIGFDGDWQGTYEAVQIAQTWAYTGGTSQYEELHLICSAVSWSGALDPKGCRDRAATLLAGVETVLRTDPTVGLGGATIITALEVGTVFQEPFPDGHACRILFTIHAHTFLAS